ncbi:MAG: tellurium resistance protein [Pseudomonadota bacterium]
MQPPRATRRPPMFPAPEFPPRTPARFARTPPAVFPVILGLLGLGLALRTGIGALDLNLAPAEVLLGAVAVLWLFAVLAYGTKIARRPGVVIEDLRVLPGRSGLAAATMGGMAMASVLAPYAPGVAVGVLFVALALHGVTAVLLIRLLLSLPPEGREVNPTWHLSFVGFIVGAVAASGLGMPGLATGLLVLTLPVAAAIWGVSLAQLVRRIPPAPLRPLLAIHLSPAGLFCTVAALTGHILVAQIFAALGAVILLVLLGTMRWITAAGFTPLWGAFTFPLAAYATALLVLGAPWTMPGLIVLIAALGANPVLAWKVLTLWQTGSLAARTNAAEA